MAATPRPVGRPRFDFDAFLDAARSRDLDRMLAFFADDAEIRTEGELPVIRGKDAIRRLSGVAGGFGAVGDLEIEPRYVFLGNDGFSALARIRMTYVDDVVVGQTRLPLRGRTVDTLGALFATLDAEGRIRSMTRLRDTRAVMKQLGLSEPDLAGMERAAASMIPR